MRSLNYKLVAFLLAAAVSVPRMAAATTFLTFSQTGTDIVTATKSGIVTTINVTDGSVSIGTIDAANSTPFSAYLNLAATSINAAAIAGGYVNQLFSGTFSVTSGLGDTGTDFLSGTFTNAYASGKNASLTISVSQPPAADLSLASDVVSSADLSEQQALSLSFTNVTPGISLDGTTLGSFVSNISGTASGLPVSEPAGIAILLAGLTGIAVSRRPRRAFMRVSAA
jgi:hypothetical protein